MAPVIEPHNSVCSIFCQEPKSQHDVATRSQEDGAIGSSTMRRCQSGLREGGKGDPCPSPHNSVCPRFCPDLGIGPPGIEEGGVAKSPELEKWG